MPDTPPPPDRPNPVAAALTEAAARRAAEMHAELPEEQRAMMQANGMIE